MQLFLLAALLVPAARAICPSGPCVLTDSKPWVCDNDSGKFSAGNSGWVWYSDESSWTLREDCVAQMAEGAVGKYYNFCLSWKDAVECYDMPGQDDCCQVQSHDCQGIEGVYFLKEATSAVPPWIG